MRKVWRNAASVGILTIAVVVAVYESLLFVSERYKEDTNTYHALFRDATGLVVNTYVKTAGIAVGNISAIRLEGGMARVDITIARDYDLYRNAVISKRTSSIMGDYFLALAPGSTAAKRIPPGGRIETVVETAEIDEMKGKVDAITSDMKVITAGLREILGTPEGKAKIDTIITNLRDISTNLNDVLERDAELVEKTLENVEGITSKSGPDIQEITGNIKDITADLKDIIRTHEGDVGETVADLKGGVKTLDSALAKLDRTMGNVEGITEDVREEKGALGKLISNEQVAQNVEDAVEGAGSLLKSISRLQMIVSLRSDYNFLATTLKTYVSVSIQPKEDKFYLIEIVDDPRGKTSVEELQVETTNLDEPTTWHEKRIKKTDAFKFTFQFGRKLSFVTFRFGIKESTGGVGVDFFFLKESLKVEMDLFDFGSNVYPRFKVAAALRFLRKIYVIGGVDDVLNKGQRDYFIGLQLRFNDEDLKAVLAFLPTGSLQ